jgi:hypothetical protein
MFKSKKKAQISIEALILVGIIVLGATIFASMYLNRIARGISDSTNLDSGLSDLFYDSYGSGTDSSCLGGYPLHCCNGIIDADETDVDCGGSCAACLPDTFIITLTLDPLGSSPINQTFRVNVNLTNTTGQSGAKISDVIIKDDLDDVTSNCTLSGYTTPTSGSYTNLDISFTNNLKTLNFTCSAEGTYNISVDAGIPNTTYLDSKATEKIITSEPSSAYSVKIIEPAEGAYLAMEKQVNFRASITPTPLAGENDSCVWFVNDELLTPLMPASNSCSLENIMLSEPTFKKGENEIVVYATRRVGGVMTNNAKASVLIKIIDMPNPGELILFAPRSVFVGDNFNLKIYGLDYGQVTAGRSYSDFSFTANKCRVTSSFPVCGSTAIIEGAISTTIYFCDYTAVCSRPSYAQTSPHDPTEVTASLSGSTPAAFFSIYDLAYYSGNCNTSATEYGILQSCVAPFSGGLGYNDDYWSDSSYGLLKSHTDDSVNDGTTNIYGTLIGYIS